MSSEQITHVTLTNIDGIHRHTIVPCDAMTSVFQKVGAMSEGDKLEIVQVSGVNDATCPIDSLRELNTTHFRGCKHRELDCGHFVMLEKEEEYVRLAVDLATSP